MSSKHAKPHSASPKPQPKPARRPAWLAAVLILVGGVVLVSALAWLIQRNAPVPTQDAPSQAAPSAAAVDGPRISVDQDRFDYGDVKLNSTVETTIRVRNIGDAVLALDPNPVVELIEGC